jgi:hypothetical protein
MGPMPPDHLQRAPPISSYFTLCMLQRSRFSFCDAHKGKEKGKKEEAKNKNKKKNKKKKKVGRKKKRNVEESRVVVV